jgi:hypothetical protein
LSTLIFRDLGILSFPSWIAYGRRTDLIRRCTRTVDGAV